MIVVGVDPALVNTGWCIINNDKYMESGTIKTDSKKSLFDRVDDIVDCIKDFLIPRLKDCGPIDVVNIEETISVGRGASDGTRKQHIAYGAIIATLGNERKDGCLRKSKFVSVHNRSWKSDLGLGNSSKLNTRKFVEDVFGVVLKEHEADAFCIALYKRMDIGNL